jgi:vitamin B12 transporter
MRRLFTYIFCLISPLIISGQTEKVNDTIMIEEITVRESSLASVISGFRNTCLDSLILKEYKLESLSEIITENSSLFIKSYGPGSSSTISFRGTGAAHTQVLWNELNLNSPMLGQSDLSLIPSGFIDEIRIFNGGASMVIGSGGLGGAINLETKPEWTGGTNFLLNSGAGSFGRVSSLMKLSTGNEKFQSVTRAFLHSARNDFPFINSAGYSEPVEERRQNASVSQIGLMQELYWRSASSITSASMWYQKSERNLPSTILSQQQEGDERQMDESMRAVLRHNYYFSNADIEATCAWFYDQLNYLNIPLSIDSHNRSNTLIAKFAAESSYKQNTHLRLDINNEINFINSVNYQEPASRFLTTITGSARHISGEKLGIAVLVREIISDFRALAPDLSLGADLKLSDLSNGFVRMNFSRNSRIPSMNDLYWNPGGNPDLKNEYAYTGDLSFEIAGNISERIGYKTELTTYAGWIKDMISWQPSGNSGIWTPQNISEASTNGFESDIEVVYKLGRLSARVNALYAYNRAFTEVSSNSTRHQLIYVPLNHLNAGLRTGIGSLYAGITTSFTGKRYTTADNDHYLPGYTLCNFLTGYNFRSRKSLFDFTFKAENIFNVSYEVMAYYPMAGRSFLFSITYHLNR